MRIQKKDFPWIMPLCLAAAVFVNIAIQANLHSRRQAAIQEAFAVAAALPGDKKSAKPEEPFIAETQKVQPLSLPFELRGTIVGKPCLAFIYNTDTEKSAIYKINDFVGDYKLVFVSQAKVLLEKGNITRELYLVSRKGTNYGPAIYVDEFGTTVVSSMYLFRQLPKANELLAKLKILPLPKANSDKLIGFSIDNVPAGSIVDEAGIRNGDILHSVEGRELQSVQDAWQVFNTVRKQSRFEVTLLRDQKPLTLKYEIRNR